jgi:aminoglycoside 2'-N-acetyltransferase I
VIGQEKRWSASAEAEHRDARATRVDREDDLGAENGSEPGGVRRDIRARGVDVLEGAESKLIHDRKIRRGTLRTVAVMEIRRLTTPELGAAHADAIRALLTAAFAEDEHGGFSEDDWQHALGGLHFLVEMDGRIVGHASVVERVLTIGNRPVRTGYVEAVAIAPEQQRLGLGSQLMRAVDEHIDGGFELGALGTGSQPFYERLGWEVWRGPSHVRTSQGLEPTPGEDGYILVLRTRRSPSLRLTDPISCEWRPGDAW